MNNMSVLEKILEEIEHEVMTNKEIGRKQCEGMARVMNIIRSHMNNAKDTNVPSNWIPVEERLPEEGKEVLAQFVVRVRHTNGQVDEMVYISFTLRGRKMEKLSRNAERKGGSMAAASRDIQRRKRK